jgi:hypothetical protein
MAGAAASRRHPRIHPRGDGDEDGGDQQYPSRSPSGSRPRYASRPRRYRPRPAARCARSRGLQLNPLKLKTDLRVYSLNSGPGTAKDELDTNVRLLTPTANSGHSASVKSFGRRRCMKVSFQPSQCFRKALHKLASPRTDSLPGNSCKFELLEPNREILSWHRARDGEALDVRAP